MRTDRSMLSFFLLSFCTCGIYAVWWWASVGTDLDVLVPETTGLLNYWLVVFIVDIFTCGIWSLVWKTQASNKIGEACRKYRSPYTMAGSDFWIYSVLLSLVFIGPFIYIYKVCQCMNSVCATYNAAAIQNSPYSTY